MNAVELHAEEARRTRARIEETIDELSRRLDPSRILATARESGEDALGEVGDFARANPLLLGAAALGIGFLLFQSNRASGRSSYVLASDDDEYEAYGEGDSYLGGRDEGRGRIGRGWTQVRAGVTSAGERLGFAGDGVRAGIESASTTLGDLTGDAAHRAGEGLRAARAAAARAADQAGTAARRALHDAEETVEGNPVAMVAAALAFGAALAFLIPDGED